MKILTLLLCLLIPVTALGWQQSILVEWGYTPPNSPAVSGFNLYQEGSKVCHWGGSSVSSGECDVELLKQSTSFTLTAMFVDNTESPHSSPFILKYVQEAPVLLKIEVAQ